MEVDYRAEVTDTLQILINLYVVFSPTGSFNQDFCANSLKLHVNSGSFQQIGAIKSSLGPRVHVDKWPHSVMQGHLATMHFPIHSHY